MSTREFLEAYECLSSYTPNALDEYQTSVSKYSDSHFNTLTDKAINSVIKELIELKLKMSSMEDELNYFMKRRVISLEERELQINCNRYREEIEAHIETINSLVASVNDIKLALAVAEQYAEEAAQKVRDAVKVSRELDMHQGVIGSENHLRKISAERKIVAAILKEKGLKNEYEILQKRINILCIKAKTTLENAQVLLYCMNNCLDNNYSDCQ